MGSPLPLLTALRWAGSLALVGILIVSCGGRSDHDGSGGSSVNQGGLGATGGSTATGGFGGAVNVAGTESSSAGSAGSLSVTGGSGGTGGTIDVGAAGALPDDELPRCLQPRDAGSCRGAFEHWAFDPLTLSCVSFLYGGCEGNENNFTSIEECQSACVTALPQGCDQSTTSKRPDGCPCTGDGQCAGSCNGPSIVVGGACRPATAGYCATFRGEGSCFCLLNGASGCGV